MSNWYEKLKKAMESDGEDFSKMVCTLTDEELHEDFADEPQPDDDSYYPGLGRPFTAWGEKWVYFPLCYDSIEVWVGHAPRNPCDIALKHQGRGF